MEGDGAVHSPAHKVSQLDAGIQGAAHKPQIGYGSHLRTPSHCCTPRKLQQKVVRMLCWALLKTPQLVHLLDDRCTSTACCNHGG